jgi:shikimate dehydrogenase
MTDQYAVIGNPVAHSKSPLIHAQFARQTGQDISYAAVLAPLDGMRDAVSRFRDAGGRGMNVTLPFKREAWALCGRRVGDAERALAVNTLDFRNGEIVGHNTDGVGLLRDIKHNLGCALRGARVLLMGAGGASYGVLEPLLREKPDEIVIANRTLSKAEALAAHFADVAVLAPRGIKASRYDALDGAFDMVVNATSAGLTNELPPLTDTVFAAGATAYDMVYGDTQFIVFARARGVRAVHGIGMLVEQAAESFYIWRGVRPDTAPVIAALTRSA